MFSWQRGFYLFADRRAHPKQDVLFPIIPASQATGLVRASSFWGPDPVSVTADMRTVWGQEDEPRGSCRLHQLGHLQASAGRRDSVFFQALSSSAPGSPGLHNLLFIKQKSAIPNPSASASLPEEGRILEALIRRIPAASRLVAFASSHSLPSVATWNAARADYPCGRHAL